jgi:16S rRNA (guanine(966)-N(2))-methyltransferase RsmD
MRYQVRIIAGSLRGRKLTLVYNPHLRPLADRAREALFSILGDAVPDRPFFDIFAGSGAVGIEALSRGASKAVFVERDSEAMRAILSHLQKFGLAKQAQVLRADAYRWADKWLAPKEPVNVFLGPPYQEIEKHFDAISWLVTCLQDKLAAGSVLILQSDDRFHAELLPDAENWDVRHYGRTQLAVWPKAVGSQPSALSQTIKQIPADS